mmetsp:Transcript_25921/g.63808  ORF Transcript_25921/g.63808 Transcript_25921/m.63808 type:complete len:232 (+) Transcript_25921:99-794(+)
MKPTSTNIRMHASSQAERGVEAVAEHALAALGAGLARPAGGRVEVLPVPAPALRPLGLRHRHVVELHPALVAAEHAVHVQAGDGLALVQVRGHHLPAVRAHVEGQVEAPVVRVVRVVDVDVQAVPAVLDPAHLERPAPGAHRHGRRLLLPQVDHLHGAALLVLVLVGQQHAQRGVGAAHAARHRVHLETLAERVPVVLAALEVRVQHQVDLALLRPHPAAHGRARVLGGHS